MNDDERALLLRTYGEEYGPDAGPWNTSVKSKYLEHAIARFFEENFTVGSGFDVCNVGIGAGGWDRYLSYRLNGGRLTSIDVDGDCCRLLELRLINEKNPNAVTVIHADLLTVSGMENRFDLVTMVGSTRQESGSYEPILTKAMRLVKPGGSFYYQTLDKREETGPFLKLCEKNGLTVSNCQLDAAYGFRAQYFKAVRP